MRRVDDDLVLDLRIAARNQAQHIGGLDARDFDIHGQRGRDSERHRLKIAVVGGFAEIVKIVARHRHQLPRLVFRHPGVNPGSRFIPCRQLELDAGPGSLHDLERIAG